MLLPLINLINHIFNTNILPYWIQMHSSCISSTNYVITCKQIYIECPIIIPNYSTSKISDELELFVMDNKIQIKRKYKSDYQIYDLYINPQDISFPVGFKYENGIASFYIIKKCYYHIINEKYNKYEKDMKYFNLRKIADE